MAGYLDGRQWTHYELAEQSDAMPLWAALHCSKSYLYQTALHLDDIIFNCLPDISVRGESSPMTLSTGYSVISNQQRQGVRKQQG
jgi:hypothetical protein